MDNSQRQRHRRGGYWRVMNRFGWASRSLLSSNQASTCQAVDQAAQGNASFLLSEARSGDRLWIADITARDGLFDRLTGMGLCRGTELTVVSRGAGGSLMLAVANTRLGIGREMAAAILVRRSALSMHPAGSTAPHDAWRSRPCRQSSTPRSHSDSSNADPSSFAPSNLAPSNLAPSTPTENCTMSDRTHLRDLAVGSQGRVTRYERGTSSYRQKLLAMGLTPGTEFTVTRQAPLGDPVELRVRGFQLSLRKAEADALIVEKLNDA